jgi:hypothetical protein
VILASEEGGDPLAVRAEATVSDSAGVAAPAPAADTANPPAAASGLADHAAAAP